VTIPHCTGIVNKDENHSVIYSILMVQIDEFIQCEVHTAE
jgi:hypothetical protein